MFSLNHSRLLPRLALALMAIQITGVLAAADETLLTLDEAVEQALAGNPGIAEMKARAEALAAIPSQKGALPDPNFNFDMLNVPTRSFDLRQEDMTMMEVGLSQMIPFPGKLDLQEKVAEQEALAAADSVDEARLRLARDVKLGWWRLYYYDHALKHNDEALGFLKQLVDIAQTKYRVGQGLQQDVLMAQLELSKLKDERLELLGMRHSQVAQMNVLLSRKPEASVKLPQEVQFLTPVIDESALQAKAMQSSPTFSRHGKMLEAAKRQVELAQKGFYPDLTIGAGYAFRQNTPNGNSRSDFVNLRLSVNLPIYAAQKQAKAVDQKRSELLQEQYSLEDEHNRIHGEIAAKAAEYQHARERLALFGNEIIPQAQQTVSSLLAAYQTGRSGFSDLLRAELTFFQYQTQYWQALARTQQVLAELSAVVGEEMGRE